MKTQLASLEIHYLVKELKILIDGKIDKIYQPSKEELLLQFHVPSKGKKILKILTGKTLYLTEDKEEYGAPSSFCMQLRKHLGNARLRDIQQKESERIIELTFEKKEGIKKFYIELFSKGNYILTDDKDIIITAFERLELKSRSIKPKEKYKYPKKDINLFDLSLERVSELVKSSEKDSMVTFLAVELGLGGVYSEEVCLLSKIDKDEEPSNLGDKAIKDLFENIKSITKQKINPKIVYENDKIKDIVPFELKLYEKLKQEKAPSLNEAINQFLPKTQKKESSPYEREIEKIKRVIESQKSKIKGFEESEIKQRSNAELIYQNYKLVEEVLTELNKAIEKHSWDEIKKRLKGHKVIKEVDAKEKKVILELP